MGSQGQWESAPDGARVLPLVRGRLGSLAVFELAPSQVTQAVAHQTVEELWYVEAGAGALWRASWSHSSMTLLQPGVAIEISLGVTFQFRAYEAGLRVIAATMPPWPQATGELEAVVQSGLWDVRRP